MCGNSSNHNKSGEKEIQSRNVSLFYFYFYFFVLDETFRCVTWPVGGEKGVRGEKETIKPSIILSNARKELEPE